MKQVLIIFISSFLVLSCKNEQTQISPSADEIINKSIAIAGGKTIENSIIRFDFRDKYYMARRQGGTFSLVRIFKENQDSIFDLLTNSDFARQRNNQDVKLVDSIKIRYAASVNSVHYFSVLPYGLNDKAVNKTLLGKEQIKSKTYYKIEVTFNEEGGGEDYEDVFMYWIDQASFKLDYLAYSYNEEDGKGMRFREAYNERFINGLRFVDYRNYKPKNNSHELENLGLAFQAQQLDLLSKIELKNVEVELLE